MKGNFVICHNEIVIEGSSIGNFTSMETEMTKDTITGKATIELPLYTIAAYNNGAPPDDDLPLTRKSRVGVDMSKLKVGAMIEVYCWYTSPDLNATFDTVLTFKGYIRQVIGGFPTVINCEDLSFPLRFGLVEKTWSNEPLLRDVINALLPISEKAFTEYRQRQGFILDWPKLTITESQIVGLDNPHGQEAWKDISPYDALQNLVNRDGIYVYVDDKAELHAGSMISEDNKTVNLSTDLNVVDCELVTTDSMFSNINVTLNARDKLGQIITAHYGSPDGTPIPTRTMPINTQKGLNVLAKNLYNKLVGNDNNRSITTLLYPKVNMFDYINFNHTLFPELSSGYIAMGLRNSYNDKGYRQVISVTNRVFA